jgi:hypothetical protein
MMMIGPDAHAADVRADKTNVSLWYDAFSKKDPGKIVRTWHTEDWMSGLHQLGVFDK